MKNIKHIFFDLDHTLWDFEKNSSLTFKFLIKKYDLNVSLEHFFKDIHANKFFFMGPLPR